MLTGKPAILGGVPAFRDPIAPYISTGERETAAALEVVRTGILSEFLGSPGPLFDGGRRVRALEGQWAAYFDVRHAISVNSGTSGLHAAVVAAGAGPGDEVIVPPMTMSATATAVVMAGASPVFVDIEEATCCLDPVRVESAIGPRTKAIIAVNLFGGPARVGQLRCLADRHGIVLIEDNAQGAAGREAGRMLGTVGHLGVFSLNRHKAIQCGEGGVVVTNDSRMARRLRLVRNHGENVIETNGWHEDDDVVGYNYRLTEPQAAIASVQLERLEDLTRPRIEVAEALAARLRPLSCLRCPEAAADDRHVYYLFPLWLDAGKAGMTKDVFASALIAEGAPVGARYVRPLYRLPLFQRLMARGQCFVREPDGVCSVAERSWRDTLLFTTLVQVPGGLGLVDRFGDAVERILSHVGAIAALEQPVDLQPL
jgi:dTDP-4-amino-4,6-dideoxygalactose transaminase